MALGPPTQNLTYAITGGNTNGAFALDPVTGELTVANSSELDFENTPVFNLAVTVTDAGGRSDNATITVDLNNINDNDPVADAESFTVAEAGTATEADLDVGASLLDGDTDADLPNDTLTVTTTPVSGPSHAASFNLNADGTFSYTHDGSENLSDSFTYEVTDALGHSSTAVVTITITPVNDAPVGVDDTASTIEDTPVTVTVVSNDTDVEGDSLTVSAVTQGTNGAVTFGGGTVTYTPNANFNGSDSFTYTVSDGNGGTDTATVDVTVNPVNDAPVANPGGPYSVDEDALVALDGSGSNDPDGTITLYEWDLDYDGVTFDIDATGATPVFSAAGLEGPASRTVALRVTDDGNPVMIESGSGPVTTSPGYVTPDGHSQVWFARARNFDSDGDFELGIGTVPPPDAAWQDTNQWTWSGSGNTDSFTLTYDSGTNTARLSVGGQQALFNVAGPFTDIYLQVKAATQLGSQITVDNMELDLGTGDILGGTAGTVQASYGGTTEYNYVRIHNLPGWLSDGFTFTGDITPLFSSPIASEGLALDVILANNGAFVPATGAVSAIQTTTVNINPVNDAPIAFDDSTSTNEDTPVTVNVVANDTDVEGDPLTVSAVTQGTNGAVTFGGGTVTYTPNPNFNGPDSFTYTVSDGNGGTDTATVDVTVNTVNDAPVGVDDTASTNEDTPVSVNVVSNDTDVEGDPLTVSAVTQGTNGTVTFAGGTVTYTPNANFSGPDTFTYTVSDGNGGTDTATVDVTVSPVNDPGTVTIDNLTPAQGDTLTANVTDADGAAGAITYQWFRDGVAIGGATGKTYTIVQTDVGAVITVTADYTDDLSSVESLTSGPTAPVTNVNDPGMVTINNLTPTHGDTLTASVSDNDGASGAISYQWYRDGVAITGATGVSYTTVAADEGAVITVTRRLYRRPGHR